MNFRLLLPLLIALAPTMGQAQPKEPPTDSADFYYRWAHALSDSGNYRMAILKFKKAVILRRDFPEAWTEWGVALANVGRREEEIAKYKEALKIDSTFGEAYFNWGTTLTQIGQTSEAIKVFKKGTAASPKFAKNYEGLGKIHAQMGEYQQALNNFQKSINLNSENPWAQYWAAGCWSNLKKKTEALAALQKAIFHGGDFYKMEAKKDAAFSWLKSDADFKKLIGP